MRKFKDDLVTVATVAKVHPVRNAQHRIRIATIAVDLWLDAAASTIASPDRILAQFEDFYLVTLSVRSGIPVTVREMDVNGSERRNVYSSSDSS